MKTIVFAIVFTSLCTSLHAQKNGHLTIPGIGEVDLSNPLNLSLPTLPGFNLTNLFATPNLTGIFSALPCVSTASARPGTCRKEKDCLELNDLPDGPCALNLGVCCTKAFSCNSVILGNVTIITNPGYPQASSGSSSCEFTFSKLPLTHQFRLDFEDFDIADCDDAGRCSKDVFEVQGANPGFEAPRLCGMNKGQHIYIPVDKTGLLSTLKLRFTFSSDEIQRLFKIRVTQLDGSHPNLAPAGCLQYFSGKSGSVTSFNFEHNKRVGIKTIKGLNYGVCFRPEEGCCSVRLDPSFTRVARSVSQAPQGYAPRPVDYRPRYYQPNYFRPNHIKPYAAPLPVYYPVSSSTESPKVQLLEDKIEFLEEKKKLIEELLAGMKIDIGKIDLSALPALPTLPPLPALPTIPTLAPIDLNKLSKELLEGKINLLEEQTQLVKDLLDKKEDVPQLFIPKIPVPYKMAEKYPQTYGSHEKLPVGPNYNSYQQPKETKIQEKTEIIENKINEVTNLIKSKVCEGKDSIGIPPLAIICDDNSHPVLLSTTPFTIFVDTRGQTPSRGFHFTYNQQVC